jgi:hypothetical protein
MEIGPDEGAGAALQQQDSGSNYCWLSDGSQYVFSICLIDQHDGHRNRFETLMLPSPQLRRADDFCATKTPLTFTLVPQKRSRNISSSTSPLPSVSRQLLLLRALCTCSPFSLPATHSDFCDVDPHLLLSAVLVSTSVSPTSP